MPARIEPCVAILVDTPPSGPQWAFEVKWGGYRLAVHVEPGRVRVITRGGYDWTRRFTEIAAEARELGHESMILDGEGVVLDEKGRSDFGALQRALGRRPSLHDPREILFFAFDLLYLDGHDLWRKPLRERRRLLEQIVAGRKGVIRLSEEVEGDGDEFYRVACEHGLEGIIAKHREKTYHSGRGDWWQKITCRRRDSFVYVGGCGTGWSNQQSVKLRELLDTIKDDKPPVALRRKGVVFVRPLLVAEVEYRAWTEDEKLRHPSFKGLRDRADDATVFSLDRGQPSGWP
ncbi:ATP-dependent DNA ligase [Sinorhizobium meliloti]|uniref:ATP-dependent DNA ligase n=1 Tax=Rhizobium meliloti TaxID=382 RepID=UPI00307DD832